MSNDDLTNGHNPEVSFEREDLRAGPIITALTGLGIVCILASFVVLWMYNFLNRYQAAHQTAQSPLVAAEKDTRRVTPEQIESFPQPRLETDERGQLDSVRTKEEDTLATYGWVDESAGVVRIPIERAMQIIAEHGLPTRPTSAVAAAPTTTGKPKPTGKAKGM